MRRLIARCGAIIGVLFLVSAADTFICGHLDPKDHFRALPGTRLSVSGNLYRPVRHPEDVRFHFVDPGLQLTIAEVKGSFWRGEVTVPPKAAEGVYRLSAHSGADTDPAHIPIYRITVFSSPRAMNASYPSLIRRILGFPAWWLAAASGPLLVVCLTLSFYLANDRERQFSKQGLSPIVKLARRKDHWELAAALIPTVATTPGAVVEVTDRDRRPITRMTVERIEKGMAFGQVDATLPLVPDGYVRFSPPSSPETGRMPTQTDR
ncbi:hypothetical protein [Desulfosarcina cetonica]|uniref:hypothetical protein n=1 Tax=Desulfosarcina cetonica TaxID=90730 RepID=UPI0012ECD51D|nr:hypothetical protein [Desulfosarcina cetonica]